MTVMYANVLNIQIPDKELKLQTKIEWFYNLCGVSNEAIRPFNEVVLFRALPIDHDALRMGQKYCIRYVNYHRCSHH